MPWQIRPSPLFVWELSDMRDLTLRRVFGLCYLAGCLFLILLITVMAST